MSDRVELLEAALDLLDEGMVLLDEQGRVVIWNRAAAALTGYRATDMLSRACPECLYAVDEAHLARADAAAEQRANGPRDEHEFAGLAAGYADGPARARDAVGDGFLERPALVAMKHRLGHAVPAMLRRLPLRDGLGARIGAAMVFYPVEEADALPHGETATGAGIERSQAEMEDRLDEAQHQWVANRVPFGLMWITIDQAAQMRKTHGRDACEAMVRTMEQTLVRGLKPGETLGRWGNDEFLVLSHQRTAEMEMEHGQRLAGLARTADFRWWGDRVNLTVSIGMSQVMVDDTLHAMLERARGAMQKSLAGGGNHVLGGNHAGETRDR